VIEGDIFERIFIASWADKKQLLLQSIYGAGTHVILSDVLPILACMGLRVLEARPYELDQNGDGSANTWSG